MMKLLSRGEASQHFSTEQWAQIEIYLRLVMQRTTGAAPTTAAWIRSLIDKHEAYKQDSVVPDRVVYDLVQECIRRNEVV